MAVEKKTKFSAIESIAVHTTVLKRDSDGRGMNLKVKHKVGLHLFPKLCVVFPPKFSSRETVHLGFDYPRPFFSWADNLLLIIYPTH